ncbi:MAG TPA: hypothetical protein VGF59_19925 [Bryobacteraceae bacterium]
MGVKKLRLKSNHTWKSRPGYSICVIDRGAVRFDYPSHWIVEPGEGAVHLHDQPPSVESCDLGVSIFRVPLELVRDLSLDETLHKTLGEEREPYRQSQVQRIDRLDVEIAWLEQFYVDADYKRDAKFRVALARGDTLCLISMNYWLDRASQLEPVWEEVLRTLLLDVPINDPAAGPVVQ